MSDIGERIRSARKRAVLGQGELADKAGISRNALWQIETGRKTPRPATIRKIAEALGLPPGPFIADTPEIPGQQREG